MFCLLCSLFIYIYFNWTCNDIFIFCLKLFAFYIHFNFTYNDIIMFCLNCLLFIYTSTGLAMTFLCFVSFFLFLYTSTILAIIFLCFVSFVWFLYIYFNQTCNHIFMFCLNCSLFIYTYTVFFKSQ